MGCLTFLVSGVIFVTETVKLVNGLVYIHFCCYNYILFPYSLHITGQIFLFVEYFFCCNTHTKSLPDWVKFTQRFCWLLFKLTNLGAGGQDSSNRESNWKGWRLINTVSALRAIPNLFLIRYTGRAPFRSPQNWLTHSLKHTFCTPWHPAWERHHLILEKVLLPDSGEHWSRAAKKDQNERKRQNKAQWLPVWQSGQGTLTWHVSWSAHRGTSRTSVLSFPHWGWLSLPLTIGVILR